MTSHGWFLSHFVPFRIFAKIFWHFLNNTNAYFLQNEILSNTIVEYVISTICIIMQNSKRIKLNKDKFFSKFSKNSLGNFFNSNRFFNQCILIINEKHIFSRVFFGKTSSVYLCRPCRFCGQLFCNLLTLKFPACC